METVSSFSRPWAYRPAALASIGAAALLALAFYAAVALSQPILAAIAGAGGLALLRWAWADRPYSATLVAIDAAAFAIFAIQRNDSIGFWQLPGPWADVWRFDPPGAAIALIVYVGGSILALVGGARGLRLVEGLSLIAVPFLFNLLLTVGADWRMAGHGRGRDRARKSVVSCSSRDRTRAHPMVRRRGDFHADQPGQRQPAAAIGPRARAVCAERRGRRRHPPVRQRGAMGRSAARWRLSSPAPARRSPKRACGRSSIFSPALRSIGLAGARRASRRSGSIGGPASSRARFTARCSWASFSSPPGPARAPAPGRSSTAPRSSSARLAARSPFRSRKTIIGSADGTPPFFGRLMAAYRDPRGPARGACRRSGLGARLPRRSRGL